jgi:hypothetical protein
MARPDAELITLSQQGDQQAFAELVGRYQKNSIYNGCAPAGGP